tara:strand:+ start:670 stop:1194 length:525 start_codon:yes stop_codon:yes gene_type:complete
MEKEKKLILIIISLFFVLFISVGYIFYDSNSEKRNSNKNPEGELEIPETGKMKNETGHLETGPFVDFPPLEIVCENDKGYKVAKDLFGRNALSVESKLKLKNSEFDFSQILDLDCLEYLNLEWLYIENISHLENLNNLKYLSLAWTNILEEDCRALETKLLTTEVFCHHDTPEF